MYVNMRYMERLGIVSSTKEMLVAVSMLLWDPVNRVR